ncbi:glycosyltransferase family 2 protein [Terriglobus roseus]|uniref:Hemolytic protein HlpA-like protein n=1 Tax=Terriglobus roseus TaxID=392734 RepID=A0A1G7NCF1_9BACT|nr:glycosyltransferase family 2 protein [Terriglobus roseus]SDF71723.1 hypothetical protein SAMN05444167_3095 [Terriglobus roseus]
MSLPSYSCQTPVAFFVFNRPELTRKVFDRIREMRPKRLLVIADGPRGTKLGEAQSCKQVREIATTVDWPCIVETNFAPENMGCRGRLTSGLKWVFEQTEEAIILEDDVLPDPTFFRFCDEMLEHYRDDPRVSMITGFNIVQDRTATPDSYYFSGLTHIWGWATWRRAWKTYDEQITSWPAVKASGLMAEMFPQADHREHWTRIFDEMYNGTGPNTWDLQWVYTNLIHNALSIAPGVNLVDNIGFGPNATHTIFEADAPRLPVHPLQFPLRHPPAMVPLRQLDLLDQDRSGWGKLSLLMRIRRKILRQWFARRGASR